MRNKSKLIQLSAAFCSIAVGIFPWLTGLKREPFYPTILFVPPLNSLAIKNTFKKETLSVFVLDCYHLVLL